MTKTKKITYWVATIWLALGMTSTGIVQLLNMKAETEKFYHLGYPSYLMFLLGVWKLLGAIVVLLPKLPILKEWAYAGFFFTMSGAAYSHILTKSATTEILPSLLLLLLTMLSWYFRPVSRKAITG